MEDTVHRVEAEQDGVDRWGNGVVGEQGHRCGHNREEHAMLARGGVALGRERGRVASMGRSDGGIENHACLITASLCQDNCFEGDISVPNRTMSGKLTDNKERGWSAEPSNASFTETKRQ